MPELPLCKVCSKELCYVEFLRGAVCKQCQEENRQGIARKREVSKWVKDA